MQNTVPHCTYIALNTYFKKKGDWEGLRSVLCSARMMGINIKYKLRYNSLVLRYLNRVRHRIEIKKKQMFDRYDRQTKELFESSGCTYFKRRFDFGVRQLWYT
jgi:hypothetical protein